MKKLIGALATTIIFAACQPAADYKTVRDDVMKFHDVVMADHGIIVGNQMKLDTIYNDFTGLKNKYPEVDTLREKESILALKSELVKAEDAMNDWMHKFEPDITGKSQDEAIAYFQSEKLKIAAIDSLYKRQIKSSNEYLSKFNK